MIRHAWSVLCEKHIIDSETNNVSLDVVEQISGRIVAPANASTRNLLPTNIRLVSLWYRLEQEPEGGTARVSAIAPMGEDLGHFDLQLPMEQPRVRTIALLGAIPYVGPGTYQYVVALATSNGFTEVARVPLEVRLEVVTE